MCSIHSSLHTPSRTHPHTIQVRAELLKKGTVYQHVWLYALHKLGEAIEACKGATESDNNDGVHAWDESWAFYAGSQQSVGKTDGYMIYNLAQKYCSEFGTCTTDSADVVSVPIRTTRITEPVQTRPTLPATIPTTAKAVPASRTIKVETTPARVVQTATREPVVLTTPARTRRTRQTVRQTRMAAPTRAPEATSPPQRRRASQTTPVAKSNKQLLDYFNKGRDFLVDGQCVEASYLIPKMLSQMTVPLIQGSLHFAYEADLWKKDQREADAKCASSVPESAANKGKEIAAGWVFAAALLPQLQHCDAEKAKLIRDNMDVMASAPVKDTYSEVAHVLQSMYGCLGVTCADIGGLKSGGGTYFPGLEPCDDSQLSRSFTPPSAPCPLESTASIADPTTAGAGPTPGPATAGVDTTPGPNTVGDDPNAGAYVAAAFVSSDVMLTSVVSSCVALMM